MEIESNSRQVESIEKEGNMNKIYGIRTAKTFEDYMLKKIRYFNKMGDKNNEMIMKMILESYKYFHRK